MHEEKLDEHLPVLWHRLASWLLYSSRHSLPGPGSGTAQVTGQTSGALGRKQLLSTLPVDSVLSWS